MKVIVDTDVWSESLRKKKGDASEAVLQLEELIRAGQVEMLGEIRQEILSGLREIDRFVGFRTFLRVFPDRLIQTSVFENAAAIFNLLRSKGIQSSNTDCLICACALEWNVAILTKDQDFLLYQQHIPIRLYTSGF